jgi:4-amino-4-deoxy-L-arabinose transferase-like glycosyltransferase
MTACLFAAWPFAEMGFDDDWSYAKTAQIFAESGHFVYNGWASAMLGWQIWWGALFIRMFGFSFETVRMSTLVLAFLSVVLFYRILIRVGVRPRNAVLGTLTLALSPLFLVMTASYMSDIPGLLGVLVCLYCCLRAVEAGSDRGSITWLALATATNVAGGTARQIVWLGALVMLPATAWAMRRRRRVAGAAIVLWAVSAASIYLLTRWYEQQPYAAPEHLFSDATHFRVVIHSLTKPVKVLLCLLLVTLPVLSAWLPGLRNWRRRWQAGLAAGLLAALVFWRLSPPDDGATGHMMPWLLDVIGSLGSSTKGYMLGVKPAAIGFWPRAVVSLAVLAAGVAALVEIAGRVRGGRAESGRTESGMEGERAAIGWKELLWVTVPFSFCYAALFLLQGMVYWLIDRYLLVLLAISIVLLLRYYQEYVGARLPAVCWWVLGIFTIYSVAGLHDIYALQRARVRAGETLLAAGVPRTAIAGGLEYDGWTQIEVGGYVHSPLVTNPPSGGTRPLLPESDEGLLQRCVYWYYPLTPALEPKYYVVFSRLPCLKTSSYAAVEYRAWMPPFRREIYIQER